MSERAIKVIRGLRRCAPFSLSPRAIIETEANRHSAHADAFFVLRRRLRKRAFDAPSYHKKIAQPKVARFARFVIRLGFEPKTHSLEGCCSIQLSYRTDPCALAVVRLSRCPRGRLNKRNSGKWLQM